MTGAESAFESCHLRYRKLCEVNKMELNEVFKQIFSSIQALIADLNALITKILGNAKVPSLEQILENLKKTA